MITNSVPWKVELLKIASRLERRKFQRRWIEQTGFLVERDVMVSAYAVRKLLEARKVSDSLASQQMEVRQHLLIGDMPDVYNRHFIWENYDLDNGRNQAISIRELCNQIIHSWNWVISATEDSKFDGIYVSSDKGRRKFIYFINIDVLIRLLRAIGSEDVSSIEMRRDKTGEMHITRVTAAGEGAPRFP